MGHIQRLSRRIDLAVYGTLERLIGKVRAAPFHPLNRHPVMFEHVPTGESVGGPHDGLQGSEMVPGSLSRLGGESRLVSWLRALVTYWGAEGRYIREVARESEAAEKRWAEEEEEERRLLDGL